MALIIDSWSQVLTDRFAQAPWLETLNRWTGRDQASAFSTEQTLAAMDQAGVDISILSAWYGPDGPLISNDELASSLEQASDRFRGLASADIRQPAEATAQLRNALAIPGMVGVRIVPWLWGLPPNDRRYYPIYALCCELGVPVCTQIGHTGPLKSSETGRPIPYLEDVLLDFPDLVIVGGHVGYPWLGEVVSLIVKFRNFYVDTSAYTLERLPREFVDIMRGVGRERVLFGTNWPMLSPERCLSGLAELNLGPFEQKFLGETAARIFNVET